MTNKTFFKRICIAFLLAALWGSRASGQSKTRAEAWREKRLENLEQVRPAQPLRIEKILVMVEKQNVAKPAKRKFFLEKSPLWPEKEMLKDVPIVRAMGFAPVVGGISTGSGIAPGLRFRQINIGNSPLDVASTAAYSTRGYQLYDLQLGELPQSEHKWFMHIDLRYRSLPQEDFFGLGPDSRRENRTDYRIQDRFYGGVLGFEFTPWLRAAVRGGLLQVDLGPGTDERFLNADQVFRNSAIPGFTRQPDFLQLNSVLFLDYRDQPGNPHKGGVVGLSFAHFNDRGSNDFEFTRYAAEARHYLPLGSEQRVLAVRLYTSIDEPARGSRVPFYMQETLGGGNLLRGYENFRFRDSRLIYGSAEYRWEAIPALEFALFYDVGKVFSRRSDFDINGLRKSFGGGLRVKTSNGVLFRIDIARSDEGVRFNFRFGPAF